jgi:hypothetical protein
VPEPSGEYSWTSPRTAAAGSEATPLETLPGGGEKLGVLAGRCVTRLAKLEQDDPRVEVVEGDVIGLRLRHRH